MSTGTGPPQAQLKYMTPYPIADDPPTPKPIPDFSNPSHTLAQRATARFSLDGKHACNWYDEHISYSIID